MVRGMVVALGVSMMLAAGCAAPAAGPPTGAATGSGAAPASPTQAQPQTQTQPPATGAAPAAQTSAVSGGIRYEIVSTASEARYRVREQLANLEFPNDAVGVTKNITGGIVFDESGKVISDASKLVIDMASLTSDSDRRDNYVRRNALQTSTYPSAEFVPTELRGLEFPPPASGEAAFQMLGDLTVRGVSKPVVWDVKAQFADGAVSGNATTTATWADFGMDQPRVAIVLSVADTIGLEFDFQMQRAS